jgi:nitrogen regulatory protein P-II 1
VVSATEAKGGVAVDADGGTPFTLVFERSRSMHLVTAIIKAHRVETVTEALKGIAVNGMTISDVQGFGRQRGHTEVYRGSEYPVDFVPKVRIDVLCDTADADKVADVIVESARTGKIGDGKVWITEIARAIRVRTGETGDDAL